MQYSMSELEAYLGRLYGGRSLLLTSYAFPMTFVGLVAGANSQGVLAIQANADFLITRISHRAVIAAAQTVATKTAPEVRMLITDGGSNEQFTANAVDLECYSTNDGKMMNLPWPRLVQGKSTLTVLLTNYSAAETYSTLDIVFSGVLVRALA